MSCQEGDCEMEVAEKVIALYEHFGYCPYYRYEDIDCFEGWYCMGPGCGQPHGKPHLDNCVVAAWEATQ